MKVLEMTDQEIWDILKVNIIFIILFMMIVGMMIVMMIWDMIKVKIILIRIHSMLTKYNFQVLAALLHLGNIKYKSTSEKNMEASSIPDLTNVERVAAILGLTKNDLLQVGLLTKNV